MNETIFKAAELMLMGMAAIFVVMIVLYGVVTALLKFTKKKI